jgi:hypothetical protein
VDLNLGFELDFTIFKTEVLFDSDHLFKEHNIGLIDNTEEEIRDAIELFLKNRKP